MKAERVFEELVTSNAIQPPKPNVERGDIRFVFLPRELRNALDNNMTRLHKDRPVLVIGQSGNNYICLMIKTKHKGSKDPTEIEFIMNEGVRLICCSEPIVLTYNEITNGTSFFIMSMHPTLVRAAELRYLQSFGLSSSITNEDSRNFIDYMNIYTSKSGIYKNIPEACNDESVADEVEMQSDKANPPKTISTPDKEIKMNDPKKVNNIIDFYEFATGITLTNAERDRWLHEKLKRNAIIKDIMKYTLRTESSLDTSYGRYAKKFTVSDKWAIIANNIEKIPSWSEELKCIMTNKPDAQGCNPPQEVRSMMKSLFKEYYSMMINLHIKLVNGALKDKGIRLKDGKIEFIDGKYREMITSKIYSKYQISEVPFSKLITCILGPSFSYRDGTAYKIDVSNQMFKQLVHI